MSVLKLIGRKSVAEKLIKEGIKTKQDLLRPENLNRLPKDIRAFLLYSPVVAPYKTALDIANYVKKHVKFESPSPETPERYPQKKTYEIIAVGGVRRKKPQVKDIDFLVVSDNPRILSTLSSPNILTTYAVGARRRSCIFAYHGSNYKLDFFVAAPESRPFALYHHTGSAQYNIRIRAHVKRLGWKLNQYGLFDSRNRRVANSGSIKTERDLANFLGITYRTPEDRE
jgi:DNA polymerase/3'-5' exonuclease PolX